jgi:hypothetical protein
VAVSAQQKIAGQHLERLALVYLRQSSPRHVRENFGSTERQYALSEEAARLGWEPDLVITVGPVAVGSRIVSPPASGWLEAGSGKTRRG